MIFNSITSRNLFDQKAEFLHSAFFCIDNVRFFEYNCGMELNSNFIEGYLTVGKTRDNFIFTECDDDFFALARESLSQGANNVKPCCVQVDDSDEKTIGNLFAQCTNDVQRKIVTREYILQKVLLAELADEPSCEEEYKKIKNSFNVLKDGNFYALFSHHTFSDVQDFMDQVGKIELNFFLKDVDNKFLQQAINSYIASRTTYSVKLFSNKKLCSYFDLAGNVIECPHDYMSLSVKDFVKNEQNTEKLEK